MPQSMSVSLYKLASLQLLFLEYVLQQKELLALMVGIF